MSVARRHKGSTAADQQLGQHLEPLAPGRGQFWVLMDANGRALRCARWT